MYRELISELSRGNEWAKVQPPCLESEIDHAEMVVGYSFPKELRELLRETNGDQWCLLSAREIIENVERNREFWIPLFEEDFSLDQYTATIDRFIFFATNGCGDYYCYRVRPDGTTDDTTIYIWEHEALGEECCWKKVASNMTEFITRYYNSEI